MISDEQLSTIESLVLQGVPLADVKKLYTRTLRTDSHTLNDMWQAYANIEHRKKYETPFVLSQLPCRKDECALLDMCLGSGSSVIALKQAGIQHVFGNEVDMSFVNVATKNIGANNLQFRFVGDMLGGTIPSNNYEDHFGTGKGIGIVVADWLELKEKEVYQSNSFDVITCLGNSLTYLFRKKDRERTLRSFYQILKPGGVLLIDQRNYDAIIENMFTPVGKEYDYSELCPTFPYTSQTAVQLHLELAKGSHKYDLVLHPFIGDDLACEIATSGFTITDIFHDFNKKTAKGLAEYRKSKADTENYRNYPVEFIQYVARKPLFG